MAVGEVTMGPVVIGGKVGASEETGEAFGDKDGKGNKFVFTVAVIGVGFIVLGAVNDLC